MVGKLKTTFSVKRYLFSLFTERSTMAKTCAYLTQPDVSSITCEQQLATEAEVVQ